MNLEDLFLSFSLLGAEWVLWLLVGLSLVGVAIMVERAVTYRRLHVDARTLMERLAGFLRRGDRKGAVAWLDGQRGLEAAVASAGLKESDRGAAAAEETMAGVRQRERLHLERNLAFLGTVGSNAPFIGLFGTVLGIIKAFHSLAGAENAGFKVVMADISEALVATGVGLLVAIPAVVAFNVFSRRVKRILTQSESVEHLVLAHVKGEDLPRPDATASDSTETRSPRAPKLDPAQEPAR